jgi:hypothetical protein
MKSLEQKSLEQKSSEQKSSEQKSHVVIFDIKGDDCTFFCALSKKDILDYVKYNNLESTYHLVVEVDLTNIYYEAMSILRGVNAYRFALKPAILWTIKQCTPRSFNEDLFMKICDSTDPKNWEPRNPLKEHS